MRRPFEVSDHLGRIQNSHWFMMIYMSAEGIFSSEELPFLTRSDDGLECIIPVLVLSNQYRPLLNDNVRAIHVIMFTSPNDS